MKHHAGLRLCVIICIFYAGSFSQIPVNFNEENRGATCKKPTVANKTNTKLPDPFEWSDGSGRIKTTDDWSCRRNEIKAEIEHYEVGPKPEKPTIAASYSNGKLEVIATVGSNKLTLSSTVTVPSGTGPFPVAIGMGALGSNFSGCIQVIFTYGQVVNLNLDIGCRGQLVSDRRLRVERVRIVLIKRKTVRCGTVV